MTVVYSARYQIDLGAHVFPTRKYQLVHERLLQAAVIQPTDIVEPQPASWDDLALVHTREYLTKMRDGTMTEEDLTQLELPWSSEMVEGFRMMVGGTIESAHLATREGAMIVGHIGGGLHHAFPNHGEGFCPFNDVAASCSVRECSARQSST